MYEMYCLESREMVRILNVLRIYLDFILGDKINENFDLLIIYILVENLYMLLRYF